MQNNLFSSRETIEYFCLDLISMPDLDHTLVRLSALHDKDGPAARCAKSGAVRYLEHLASLPGDDACFDSIAVTQAPGRIHEIRNHIRTLLFDSKSGDLCKSRGFHDPYLRVQRMIAAPSL